MVHMGSLVPRLPPERKLKNENGGGLGMRLAYGSDHLLIGVYTASAGDIIIYVH